MHFIKSHKLLIIIISGLIITAGIILMIFFCPRPLSENRLLKKNDLQGLSVEEMVEKLEATTYQSGKFKASISGTKLKLSEGNYYVEYDLPENLFYLSIAPYISNTHPCDIHSLSGCRSELSNETFMVSFYNEENELIRTEMRVSNDNGFIGFWLPSGIEVKIVVSYGELYAETFISTFENSNTCLTTPLKLE